ncbi:hypothetical protein Skr01_27600 [Sphaerisporangium krabiense]|uniref:Uncharacterized protein n=1 Tax=Sphaerisporangium krabiense TaxID=763782 RepID=A0A7W8ZAA3_9ACTN|nr:hypothetical protein [Sphaerisporangium krabiense]MBB5630372.1 hypothetical protein [Sphaerisporangium krabiense]GII62675.1 hypothetical protein Skr01_27600 [Sphaerisporangium krabiense]
MADKNRLDLSAPQVVGSALAAATAAVAASSLGVAGTVAGAALASAATTAGNAIYTHYLHRTRDRLKEAHSLITGARAAAEDHAHEDASLARPGEEGLATAVHATVRDHGPADLPLDDAAPPVGADQAPPLRAEGPRVPLWATAAVAAVATFALSMGGILAFELVSGKPMSATVQGRGGSGTSFGGRVSEPTHPAVVPSGTKERDARTAPDREAPARTAEPGGSAPATTAPAAPSERPPASSAPSAPPADGTGEEPPRGADTGDGNGTDGAPGDQGGTTGEAPREVTGEGAPSEG